jgi:hypothetical protein
VASHVENWLDQRRIDPDNEFIGTLLSRLRLVHTKELRELSTLGAGHAGLFFTERTRSALPKALGGMADHCCDKLVAANRTP